MLRKNVFCKKLLPAAGNGNLKQNPNTILGCNQNLSYLCRQKEELLSIMEKKYCDIEAEPAMAAEAVAPCIVSSYHATVTPKQVSTRERVMASTVSVDEYFDELISHVHKDYASL